MEGRLPTEGEISEVWRNLPAEIQIKVGEDHLPISSLCRFRSVSRSWSKPKLRPGILSGLYIRKTVTDHSCLITLFKGKKRQLSLLKRGSVKWGENTHCLSCINGMLCCIRGDKHQVKFMLCNLFRGHGGTWTWLPHPPRVPKRDVLFAGMSRMTVASQSSPPPRIGVDANLDDYIFLAAMGSAYPKGLYRPINLLLQVYSGGTWSCSVFDFPDGECLMFGGRGLRNRCGVLRGSLFYFFMMRLDRSSARLCCIDLLTSDRQCKTVCELEPGLLTDWDLASFVHPKLAICSGKLLMVHEHDNKAGVCTTSIQVFDDETRTWTAVSTLPEELRGDQNFYPNVVNCGGDELFVYDVYRRYGLGYNLATGAWFPLADSKHLAFDVVPAAVVLN